MKRIRDIFFEGAIKITSVIGLLIIIFIFYFIFSKAAPVLSHSGFGLIANTGFDTQISAAFYAPNDDPMLVFGLLGLILGTLTSVIVALAVATVIGVGAAIAICELSNKWAANVLTAFVRLLSSIPSVVFGLIGIISVVPFIEKLFITTDLQIKYLEFFQMTGNNLLTTVIVLTFMIVPTIVSLSIDAIYAVPRSYKESGFALGMSHFRVILKIIIPSARSGILASVILAAGRGIGEAIAVSMVCGGRGFIPQLFHHGFASLLSPVLPLSAAIINKSEAMSVPAVESALFTCGAMLLLLGALLSVAARLAERRMRRRAGYDD